MHDYLAILPSCQIRQNLRECQAAEPYTDHRSDIYATSPQHNVLGRSPHLPNAVERLNLDIYSALIFTKFA
jgi:hypothetical protein